MGRLSWLMGMFSLFPYGGDVGMVAIVNDEYN